MSRDVTNIVLAGLGGQGILFIAKAISRAAMAKGLNVVMNEVHGMAQRGGTVVTNVRIGEVHSAAVADGCANLIVATELNEALRVAPKAGSHTVTVASEVPIYPLTSFTGFDTYPQASEVRREIEEVLPRVYFTNPLQLAQECGYLQVANTALLGAVMALDLLPVSADEVLDSIKEHAGIWSWKVNKKAFQLGLNSMSKSLKGALK